MLPNCWFICILLYSFQNEGRCRRMTVFQGSLIDVLQFWVTCDRWKIALKRCCCSYYVRERERGGGERGRDGSYLLALFVWNWTSYANNAFGETNVHLFVIPINHGEYGLQPERERSTKEKWLLPRIDGIILEHTKMAQFEKGLNPV